MADIFNKLLAEQLPKGHQHIEITTHDRAALMERAAGLDVEVSAEVLPITTLEDAISLAGLANAYQRRNMEGYLGVRAPVSPVSLGQYWHDEKDKYVPVRVTSAGGTGDFYRRVEGLVAEQESTTQLNK